MIDKESEERSSSKRGFASMPHDQVEEIARKGGYASAQKAGHVGMAERGRLGGQVSTERAGHDGMAARGREGGLASGESRRRRSLEEDEDID